VPVFPNLQSWIASIVANGCICSKSAAADHVLVEDPPGVSVDAGRVGFAGE
jgi:hypothetical protein